MCQESIDNRNDELQILLLTKKYLLENRNSLLAYGISQILDSKNKYKYLLREQLADFENSINNDFDLIIDYCDTLDDDTYEDNRIILDRFNRIYCDFYTSLSQYIKDEYNKHNIDEWLMDNLTDAFEYLAELHCK